MPNTYDGIEYPPEGLIKYEFFFFFSIKAGDRVIYYTYTRHLKTY